MGTLARAHTFTPATLIQSSQVNTELDNIVDLLNGTDTSTSVHLISASSSIPLIVDNSGGQLASFRVSASEKTKINSGGLLESVVATGTAPLVVASTTEVANLNAASVGGTAAANLAKLDADNEYAKADIYQQYSHDNIAELVWKNTVKDTAVEAGAWFQLLHSTAVLKFSQSVDGAAWDAIFRLHGDTDKAQIYQGSVADTWEDVASEPFVESKTTAWSFGVFYAGAIGTTVIQAIWVVPSDVDVITLDRIRWVFQSGAPTGTSQIKLQHKNSSGVEQNTQTISILVGDTALNTYEFDVTDWTLAEGDFLQWTVIADGGHQDISIHAQGVQSLI